MIKELSISMVRNNQMERYIPKFFFLQYFSQLRLLSKADVIALPVRKLKYLPLHDKPEAEKEYLDLLNSAEMFDPSSIIHQTFYFVVNEIKLTSAQSQNVHDYFHWRKVNHLQETGYFDVTNSMLQQAPSINSALPIAFESYLSSSPDRFPYPVRSSHF